MKIIGERSIPAAQQTVWEALNNADILRACIPGCDEMQRVSETEYKLGMVATVGPVKARFSGKLLLDDIAPPQRYTLRFEGSGGAAGFGKGTAGVTLAADAPEQTLLSYAAEAQVGGKIAQVGARLIDGIARKIAEEFFTRFETVLRGTDAVSAEQEPAQTATTAQAVAPSSSAIDEAEAGKEAAGAVGSAPARAGMTAGTPAARPAAPMAQTQGTRWWITAALVVIAAVAGWLVGHGTL